MPQSSVPMITPPASTESCCCEVPGLMPTGHYRHHEEGVPTIASFEVRLIQPPPHGLHWPWRHCSQIGGVRHEPSPPLPRMEERRGSPAPSGDHPQTKKCPQERPQDQLSLTLATPVLARDLRRYDQWSVIHDVLRRLIQIPQH